MASGEVHNTVTVYLLPVTMVTSGIFAVYVMGLNDLDMVLFVMMAIAGNLLGLYVTPDQDQEGLTRSEYKLIAGTFGLGLWFVAFWGVYATLIPHRHWISHFPVISTVIRYAYMRLGITAIIWVICQSCGWNFSLGFDEVLEGGLVFGMMLPDIGHWIFDGCPI